MLKMSASYPNPSGAEMSSNRLINFESSQLLGWTGLHFLEIPHNRILRFSNERELKAVIIFENLSASLSFASLKRDDNRF